MSTSKKRPLSSGLFPHSTQTLSLGELFATTCFPQTNLLALNLACISRYQPSLPEYWLESGVVLNKRPGNSVPHGSRLTRLPASGNVHQYIERVDVIGDLQGLTNHHSAGFTGEKLIHVLPIYLEISTTGLDEHACDSTLPSTGATVLLCCHHALYTFNSLGC
jgi:hypothetical protein